MIGGALLPLGLLALTGLVTAAMARPAFQTSLNINNCDTPHAAPASLAGQRLIVPSHQT